MHTPLVLTTHSIPLWLLVFSLFLPRIAIVVAWLQHSVPVYIPSSVNLIQILVAALVPRVLILFWIYQDQGIGLWFLLHAIGLVAAYGGGGTRVVQRRRVAAD